MQDKPKYTELCRRFLADDADFAEEALEKAFPDGFSLQKDEHTFAAAGDEKGKFFVGLSDILQALAFAEDEEKIPEIPQEWWEEIGKLYSA